MSFKMSYKLKFVNVERTHGLITSGKLSLRLFVANI